MQRWQYRLLVTARLLYMFRTLSASIIRSTKTVVALVQWQPTLDILTGYIVFHPDLWHEPVAATTVFVLLMMDAESVQNM